jgi:hypothetical protein
MLENSNLFSLYQSKSLKQPKLDTHKVDSIIQNAQLSCGCTLPNLTKSVEIRIVNHRDINSEAYIVYAEKFWKYIFDNKLKVKQDWGVNLNDFEKGNFCK